MKIYSITSLAYMSIMLREDGNYFTCDTTHVKLFNLLFLLDMI
jgi:hypothetical protein